MIAANELRIGNWVYDEDNAYSQVEIIRSNRFIKWNGVDDESTNISLPNDKAMYGGNINPIPLTPEILEKCGLKKELFEMSGCEVWHVPNTLWRVARSYRDENEYKLWHERISPPTWNLKTLKYLHELQNIIFALTGEELNYAP